MNKYDQTFYNSRPQDHGLEDALDGCERILRDEFKDHPERALYMIGTIDEAKGKK